jgi:hypothetical protein
MREKARERERAREREGGRGEGEMEGRYDFLVPLQNKSGTYQVEA